MRSSAGGEKGQSRFIVNLLLLWASKFKRAGKQGIGLYDITTLKAAASCATGNEELVLSVIGGSGGKETSQHAEVSQPRSDCDRKLKSQRRRINRWDW